MNDDKQATGPAKGLFDTIYRMGSIVIHMVESRLQLAALELQEEKSSVIKLLLMTGLTLIFTAFGLFCLLILIVWSFSPESRYLVLVVVTVVLLLLALISLIWILISLRRSRILPETRLQLQRDCEELNHHRDH